jgi:hypothetical protein
VGRQSDRPAASVDCRDHREMMRAID